MFVRQSQDYEQQIQAEADMFVRDLLSLRLVGFAGVPSC